MRHERDRINFVVTEECRSKRGVWQKWKKNTWRQNTVLQAYYLNFYA